MLLIAIGSNLNGPWGTPVETAARAVRALQSCGVAVTRTSRFYRTAPIGPGRQAPYVNLLVAARSHLPPAALLMVLHRIEAKAGRVRAGRWRARTLDLDLIAYHRLVLGWDPDRDPARMAGAVPRPGAVVVPHPRLHLRPFVVRPLVDIAPLWHHPVTGDSASGLWLRLKRQADGRIVEVINAAA
ncbi:MAG: 2-amino-4-hydroxy-6-hydroxymethyldihydropteridine diphosphokinase [Hyphomicrobiales bacterium]|nr:2-amino-4-hydroxy-6-hydroxymethyldihydropteridine diphosphokinase [Hyphomicrobiales bacterium]